MRPILILGVLRSGTSAMTRALGLLGAPLGPLANLGVVAGADYEVWENRPMRRVNEDLLEAFGGGWECPPVLGQGWIDSAEARALLPRARQVLVEEYGDSPVMVWKDPRTCITLPFWRRVFDEEPIVVFVHRHPVEVADSMRTRNDLSRGHAFAVWERFNADALLHSVGLPAAVIRYESLIEDPIGTMTHLVASLTSWGVQLPNDPGTTDMELTPRHRHHQAAVPDVLDDRLATQSQRDLFALLREVEGVSDQFALPRPPPLPNPLSVELLGLAARARAGRRDAMAARYELDSVVGSRRRLLRRLIEQTLPSGRTTRRAAARAPTPGAANPPPPS